MDVVTFLLVFIFLSLIVLLHEAGHFFAAKWSGVRVDEFGLGYPPRLFGKKIGETVYSINALPFGGFVRIRGTDPVKQEDTTEEGVAAEEKRSFETKSLWQRSSILLAGVFMNVVLGWLIFILVFLVGYPPHLMVGQTAPGSPAAIADIKEGDVILKAMQGGTTLSDPILTQDFIQLVKGAEGKEITLTLKQGNKNHVVTLAPRLNPPEGEGALGVALTEIGIPRENLWGSIKDGTLATGNTLVMTVGGLYTLITKIFVSTKIIESVAGPVGIFSIAAQAGAFGVIPLLQLMAILSLNLAILNLLPFPALDGGRFLFLIIERIKKTPVSQKVQHSINTVGFVVLVGFMILVTVKDIGKIISGG